MWNILPKWFTFSILLPLASFWIYSYRFSNFEKSKLSIPYAFFSSPASVVLSVSLLANGLADLFSSNNKQLINIGYIFIVILIIIVAITAPHPKAIADLSVRSTTFFICALLNFLCKWLTTPEPYYEYQSFEDYEE